jgi:hypothetical protein
MSPFIQFILSHISECGTIIGIIGTVIYAIYKKNKGYVPYTFTTTEYKRRFKQHQIHFNDEFKKTGTFGK